MVDRNSRSFARQHVTGFHTLDEDAFVTFDQTFYKTPIVLLDTDASPESLVAYSARLATILRERVTFLSHLEESCTIRPNKIASLLLDDVERLTQIVDLLQRRLAADSGRGDPAQEAA